MEERGLHGPSGSYAASEDSSLLVPLRRLSRRWSQALLSASGWEDGSQLSQSCKTVMLFPTKDSQAVQQVVHRVCISQSGRISRREGMKPWTDRQLEPPSWPCREEGAGPEHWGQLLDSASSSIPPGPEACAEHSWMRTAMRGPLIQADRGPGIGLTFSPSLSKSWSLRWSLDSLISGSSASAAAPWIIHCYRQSQKYPNPQPRHAAAPW